MLAAILCAIFVLLALWHFRMAFGGGNAESAAVPSVDGKPLFVPSARATVAVGVVLLMFAGLIAATSGMIAIGMPRVVLRWLCCALAFGLLARAVGDFRYVGFFKRVRGSRFARMDTWVYSPLCVALSAGVAAIVTLTPN